MQPRNKLFSLETHEYFDKQNDTDGLLQLNHSLVIHIVIMQPRSDILFRKSAMFSMALILTLKGQSQL